MHSFCSFLACLCLPCISLSLIWRETLLIFLTVAGGLCLSSCVLYVVYYVLNVYCMVSVINAVFKCIDYCIVCMLL